jgi:hypothetical protein
MTARAEPLPVWDRRAGKSFEEFMDDAPQTYETRPRRSLRQWLEAQPLYDRMIALYQESSRSAKNIKPFIAKHHIDMSEFKPVAYRSYSEFFDREFLPGARPFTVQSNELAACAEARYFGWERLDSGGSALSRSAHCRSGASCKNIGSTSRSVVATRRPCSNSAARPSSCSANRASGSPLMTSLRIPGRTWKP